MTDYTVTATINVTSELERSRLESLVNQGLKELKGIAPRYGVEVVGGSATVEE